MSQDIRLSNFKPIDPRSSQRTDLFIGVCGCESRSTTLALSRQANDERMLICAHDTQRTLAFESNRDIFNRLGASLYSAAVQESSQFLRELISTLESTDVDPSVFIDVSCFTRRGLATLLRILADNVPEEKSISISFGYTLAQFTKPHVNTPVNRDVGPVLPSFAGWTTRPELPPAAIVGLGYEEGKAAGAVEYLQAMPNVWAFIPRSPIRSYEKVVREHNTSLLTALRDNQQLVYEVGDPLNLFSRLETLLSSIRMDFNPVILPFGPKLYYVVSLLLGLQHSDVAVWHVSGEDDLEPVDRKPSRYFFGFECRISVSRRQAPSWQR